MMGTRFFPICGLGSRNALLLCGLGEYTEVWAFFLFSPFRFSLTFGTFPSLFSLIYFGI